MTPIRRIGCAAWTVRFSLLAVVVLATLLPIAMTCDQEPAVTEEPAAAVEATVKLQPTATPQPEARPTPLLTPQPTVTPVPRETPEPKATAEPTATPKEVTRIVTTILTEAHGSAESSSLAPCGPQVFHIWGDRGREVRWSPGSEDLVFAVGSEVYAVGVDGIELRKLSNAVNKAGLERTTAIDVSPDGTEAVFSTCEPLEGYEEPIYENELAVANLDGGQVRRLTENEHFDNYPSWSPDGSRIAFVSSGETPYRLHEWNDVHLYTMAASGTDVRRIANGPLVHHPPQWSPDGERIAYALFEDRGLGQLPAVYIHVVGAGGGDSQRLTDAASGPSWSPDGERIAYAKADGDEVALYTIGADGTDERRLATIERWWDPRYEKPEPAKGWVRRVSWSPDGSRIMVLANERALPGIQMVRTDGSGGEILAMLSPMLNSPSDSVDGAAWSPDGTRIAIAGDFGRGGSPAGWLGLVTVGVDGTDLRVLVGRTAEHGLVEMGVMPGQISAELAACGVGVVVPEPEANPGLVEDCKALLEVQNALAGPGGLSWDVARDIRDWEGVVVQGSPPRVREIRLGYRGLSGRLSPELSRLSELRVLDLSRNVLMGEIPAELGELKKLETLILRQNYLSGEIPPELGKLSGLIGLLLDSNNLRGEIPVELSELGELINLSLAGNNLEGRIPSELAQLTRLKWLQLEYNRLTGDIPAELGQLTRLEGLGLEYNRLTGCIPKGLRGVENNDAGRLGLPYCE